MTGRFLQEAPGKPSFIQIQKFLKAEVVFHDVRRRLFADIAEVPRLVHDAGDAFLVGGIAQDEAVLLTVGIHPLEEGGLFQIACLDLIELVGDIGAQAELMLARAGTGNDAGGCGLVTTALPDLAGEEVRLLAVAAVRARRR